MVDNQGKLFDLVAQEYPDKDTEGFISTYMTSKTRRSIDEAQAYPSRPGRHFGTILNIALDMFTTAQVAIKGTRNKKTASVRARIA